MKQPGRQAQSEEGSDISAILARALSPHGLILRGGFHFEADERAPPGPSGAPAKTVLLVGQAGPAPWPIFSGWRRGRAKDLKDPLDTWSREVVGSAAAAAGARAVSPSDRPFLPFQQWAMRAEGLKPSPLGILMHPEFGLWHAYRAALLFDSALPVGTSGEVPHLCDSCADKPCLRACPVGAYSASGFDHSACLSHIRSPSGLACRRAGCMDRNACPHGGAYRYPADMQAFHMASYADG